MSIMCFVKQLMAWNTLRRLNEPRNESQHNSPQLLGAVSRSVAYVCPFWASMNCSATVTSSHTLVYKSRSILEATKHSDNIPTCAYCCLQRLKKIIHFVSYIQTHLSYIQILLLVFQALKQRKFYFERDL